MRRWGVTDPTPAAPSAWAAQERLRTARMVLKALGASPGQIDVLGPQAAAAPGPVGANCGRLLARREGVRCLVALQVAGETDPLGDTAGRCSWASLAP